MEIKQFLKKSIKRLFTKNGQDKTVSYYLIDFLFRKVLRHNSKVNWPIHFTSTIHAPEKLVVGENTYPGDSPGVYINARNGIYIGDNTNIGPRVSLISANHNMIDNDLHMDKTSIKIGKFCWIGANAVILPGVQLGDFTTVGAGSIVTKSFTEGYCIIAGNPAKVLSEIDKDQCLQHALSRRNKSS